MNITVTDKKTNRRNNKTKLVESMLESQKDIEYVWYDILSDEIVIRTYYEAGIHMFEQFLLFGSTLDLQLLGEL